MNLSTQNEDEGEEDDDEGDGEDEDQIRNTIVNLLGNFFVTLY